MRNIGDDGQAIPHIWEEAMSRAEAMSKEDIEKAIRKIDPEKNTIQSLELWKRLTKEHRIKDERK